MQFKLRHTLLLTGALLFPACGAQDTNGAPTGDPPVEKGAELGVDIDGRSDLTVWRPSTGAWFTLTSIAPPGNPVLGQAGDVPVPGDFDGDGRMDRAVFRPSDATWRILSSSTKVVSVEQWGTVGDVPMIGDFDGDGRSDLAVYRPTTSGVSTGNVIIRQSSTGAVRFFDYRPSYSDEIPVAGDFDGDGKSDYAFYRPASGAFTVVSSGTEVRTQTAMPAGAKPVSGDFDGDGRSDVAVWAGGQFQVILSATGATKYEIFGNAGDVPVAGDFDGDGRYDYAVWKPSTGGWSILRSSDGAVTKQQWGATGDVPLGDPFFGWLRPILKPDARVLGSAARSALVSYNPANGDILFKTQSTTNFQVGNVLVSEPTPVLPYGLPPRRIVGKTSLPVVNFTTYRTVPAALTDIIEQGQVSVRRDLSAANLQRVDENGNPVQNAPGAPSSADCAPSGIGIKCQFSVPDGSSPVKLKGSLEFKLKQEFALRIHNLTVEEFKAALGVDEKVDLALEYQSAADLFQLEALLGTWRVAKWVIPIGGLIPITVEMYVKFKLGADGKVALATEYGVHQDASVLHGYRYTPDGGWETINQRSFGLNIKEPATSLTVNGQAKGYLAAVPGIGIYAPAKVVGAESDIGSVRAYAKLKVQYPGSPLWNVSAGLEFCSGIDLTLKFNLFLIKPEFKFQVAEGDCKEWELWTKSGGVTAEVNLARSATVTSLTNLNQPGWALANVNDGVRDSVVGGSMGWSSILRPTADYNEYVRFDLGSSATLTKIALFPRNDASGGSTVGDGFPVDFSFEVSNDGVVFQTVLTRAGVASPSGVQVFDIAVPSARYVRVVGTKLDSIGGGSYYMQLAEIEIYGRK